MSVNKQLESDEKQGYLVFFISDVRYGTKLLEVREVLEFIPPKPVPCGHKEYLGVINVRGEIIGVVDINKKLGHPDHDLKKNEHFLMIIETSNENIACVVDRIELVANFNEADIDIKHAHSKGIESLLGIAKYKNELVNIIDLPVLLKEDITLTD